MVPDAVVRDVPAKELDLRYQRLRLPCSTAERAALQIALERDGLREPLLASDGIEQGVLVLLDGFTRLDLLSDRASVPVRVVSFDAPRSLAAMLAANAGRAAPSVLEEGWVVHDLHRAHGLEQVAIASLLGRDKSWVCRRLKLVEQLERQVQDDVRLGLIASTVARQVVRLPRGNQAAAAQAVARHQLSSRQASLLVDVLLRTPRADRGQVLANPLAHLPEPDRSRDHPPDARLSGPANVVRRHLLRMHSAADRLLELFAQHPPATLRTDDRRILGELTPAILTSSGRALALVRELVLDRGIERDAY